MTPWEIKQIFRPFDARFCAPSGEETLEVFLSHGTHTAKLYIAAEDLSMERAQFDEKYVSVARRLLA